MRRTSSSCRQSETYLQKKNLKYCSVFMIPILQLYYYNTIWSYTAPLPRWYWLFKMVLKPSSIPSSYKLISAEEINTFLQHSLFDGYNYKLDYNCHLCDTLIRSKEIWYPNWEGRQQLPDISNGNHWWLNLQRHLLDLTTTNTLPIYCGDLEEEGCCHSARHNLSDKKGQSKFGSKRPEFRM